MDTARPTYVRRLVDDELDAVFGQLPAVLLDGPKGVGKTATALRRSKTVRRLDVDSERAIVEADPTIIGADPPPVLVDEWHRAPAVWDAVRRLVDESPQGGRFLLTGSAPTRGTHSGAGRITTIRMRPLSLYERRVAEPTVSFAALLRGHREVSGRCELRLKEYVDQIVSGGFPGMRHVHGPALLRQLDSYLARVVDHDMREAGFIVRRPATLRAWLRAYAAATATTTSWEKLRDAATAGNGSKPARSTTIPYVELLTTLRLLEPIDAWLPSHNRLSALGVASKHHLADPALAARLLRLDTAHLLHGHEPAGVSPADGPLAGRLFESLVALSIRTFAQGNDAGVFHLRTKGGRQEVDLIVETGAGVVAIEVKLGATVDDRDVAHLRWLRDRVSGTCIDTVVITTGPEAYRRADGIAVIPLGLLGP